MAQQLTLHVDGQTRSIEVDDPAMPLLYALRDELGLINPRFGCGLGQCGACTVHVDGRSVRSCITPVRSVEGKTITTLAGVSTPESDCVPYSASAVSHASGAAGVTVRPSPPGISPPYFER